MSLDVHLMGDLDPYGEDFRDICFYTDNITHNLAPLARQVGLYYLLWVPKEIGKKYARDLIDPLTEGLDRLKKKDIIL